MFSDGGKCRLSSAERCAYITHTYVYLPHTCIIIFVTFYARKNNNNRDTEEGTPSIFNHNPNCLISRLFYHSPDQCSQKQQLRKELQALSTTTRTVSFPDYITTVQIDARKINYNNNAKGTPSTFNHNPNCFGSRLFHHSPDPREHHIYLVRAVQGRLHPLVFTLVSLA